MIAADLNARVRRAEQEHHTQDSVHELYIRTKGNLDLKKLMSSHMMEVVASDYVFISL